MFFPPNNVFFQGGTLEVAWLTSHKYTEYTLFISELRFHQSLPGIGPVSKAFRSALCLWTFANGRFGSLPSTWTIWSVRWWSGSVKVHPLHLCNKWQVQKTKVLSLHEAISMKSRKTPLLAPQAIKHRWRFFIFYVTLYVWQILEIIWRLGPMTRVFTRLCFKPLTTLDAQSEGFDHHRPSLSTSSERAWQRLQWWQRQATFQRLSSLLKLNICVKRKKCRNTTWFPLLSNTSLA